MEEQDRIRVIQEVTAQLFTAIDFEERLRRILQVAMQSVDAEGGSILLYEPSMNALVFRYVVGDKSHELQGMSLGVDEGIAGEVFQTGQPKLTLDPAHDPQHSPRVDIALRHRTTSLLTVPMRGAEGERLGVMQLVNRRQGVFTEDDLAMTGIIADIAALAIQNARLARDAELAHLAETMGAMAHDIKNKVNVVLGWLTTLDPYLSEIARVHPDAYMLMQEAFGAIHSATVEVYRDTQLVADAIKGAGTEANLEPHSFAEIVESRVHAIEPLARQKRVTLKSDIKPTPPAMLDKFLIERMVYNLLHNAIEATPPGGTVTVRAHLEDNGGRHLYLGLEVSDTGEGMPSYRVREILDGRASSSKAGGTGLGTRIIRNAVLAHKGHWDATSQPGKGTTFRVRLPLQKAS
ncbi:MAG: GAF domain-containing sensor histidine kinase [Fimbriimonadales bacterium]|nr:GAF domain-containing sensor histidine kinase [Fimbriimonadales bacterium]